jgi:hypothetical protein
MRPKWDDRIALKNPDKGWYHHYPDNHVDKYIVRDDADLLQFPGSRPSSNNLAAKAIRASVSVIDSGRVTDTSDI